MTICLIFWRSVLSSGTSPARWLVTASWEREMIGSTSASTSATRSLRSNCVRVSGILPASMREMSRMSLMMASRWCALLSTRSRLRRWCGVSSPVTPLSSMLV